MYNLLCVGFGCLSVVLCRCQMLNISCRIFMSLFYIFDNTNILSSLLLTHKYIFTSSAKTNNVGNQN